MTAQPALAKDGVEESLLALIVGPEQDLFKDPEYEQYLITLTSYGVEQLAKEPEQMQAECTRIKQQLEDLAFKNYKALISANDCIHDIRVEMTKGTRWADSLLGALPTLSNECERFIGTGQQSAAKRATSRLTLQHHAQILELLEIPQLMDTCVRNGFYEEALQLEQFAQRFHKMNPDIKIIQDIAAEVASSAEVLLAQLHAQLRTNVQLPACLKIIGFLRRLEIYSESELRISFLKSRDAWLQGMVDAIPTAAAYGYLSKLIDHNRNHMFDIITQYSAIFPEDPQDAGQILYSWINYKVAAFLAALEEHLPLVSDCSSIALLLDQCMYFGMSLSRIDVDFRMLLPPIFEKCILQLFSSAVAAAAQRFVEQLKAYRWSTRTSSAAPSVLSSVTRNDPLAPPTELIEFPFLAFLTNSLLTAFNELRQCAPLGLIPLFKQQMEDAIASVVSAVRWLKAETRFASPAEEAAFSRMCQLLVEQQLPHLSRCFDAVFHSPKPLLQLSSASLLADFFAPPTLQPVEKPVVAPVAPPAQPFEKPVST